MLPEIEHERDDFYFAIFDCEIAGLESGSLASGLPKLYYPMRMATRDSSRQELAANAEKRSVVLASATLGSGHDCWLKSPVVWGYVVAAQPWIQQFARYTSSMRFVSSQSTMVLVAETPLEILANTLPQFCLGASLEEIQRVYKLIKEYRDIRSDSCASESQVEEAFVKAKAALPACTLGVRFQVNYMTLKTIYKQRAHHKCLEWKLFIDWMERLPRFKELIGGL